MADGGAKRLLLGGWHKWVTLGVVVLLLALLVNGIFGKRIRLAWIAGDLENRPEEVMEEIRALGSPYRSTLRAAILRGGYSLVEETLLFQVALSPTFDLAISLRPALASEDPVVSRAAVLADLDWDRDGRAAGNPVADDVYGALVRWANEDTSNSPLLGAALNRLKAYRDPRVAVVAMSILDARSAGEDLESIGRANSARAAAAQLLGSYPEEPGVFDALVAIVKRERGDESSWVQTYAWQSLAFGGYAEDPELYWIAARSENDLIRQMVASNLERVQDPRVLPILELLLADRREVVRRGALDTLIARRAPIIVEQAEYLAEDQFSSIRGDIVDALGLLRKKEKIPFVAWCLTDTDPIVVEKTILSLLKLTGQTWVFTGPQYRDFELDWNKRQKLIADLMIDEPRKELAVQEIGAAHGGIYGPEDRIPHLIRMLGHADVENVKRAMRLLAELTGRKEGFDPALLDPAAADDAEADAIHRLMTEPGVREKLIADWQTWWTSEHR